MCDQHVVAVVCAAVCQGVLFVFITQWFVFCRVTNYTFNHQTSEDPLLSLATGIFRQNSNG